MSKRAVAMVMHWQMGHNGWMLVSMRYKMGFGVVRVAVMSIVKYVDEPADGP